jgi:hypothetical protein
MVVLPLLFAFAFTQNDYDLEKMNVESSGPQPPYRCKIITTSKKYMYAPGNMVASVNLATAKKNGCATSYGCAHGNMVASVNLPTAKKEVAQPSMVALLAILLHPLTCLPQKKMVA